MRFLDGSDQVWSLFFLRSHSTTPTLTMHAHSHPYEHTYANLISMSIIEEYSLPWGVKPRTSSAIETLVTTRLQTLSLCKYTAYGGVATFSGNGLCFFSGENGPCGPWPLEPFSSAQEEHSSDPRRVGPSRSSQPNHVVHSRGFFIFVFFKKKITEIYF